MSRAILIFWIDNNTYSFEKLCQASEFSCMMWYKNGHILSFCTINVHYHMRAFALSNGWDLRWIPVGASSGETARQYEWHVLSLNLRVLWISSGNQSFSIHVLTGSCTMIVKKPQRSIIYFVCMDECISYFTPTDSSIPVILIIAPRHT